nr:reverse transcriptase domain-containing protein [Tanacetum cinerariifolium]
FSATNFELEEEVIELDDSLHWAEVSQSLCQPTSAVRNTLGREQAPQNLVSLVPDEDLREYCDKNYHQILPIIAEKLHQENVQQEKLKAVKARLNFEEASQYFESETPSKRREYYRRTEAESESEGSARGHWKSKPKKKKSSMEDDLSQPWVCEETDPFNPRIRYFDFPKTRMPSHIKTYDGSKDLKDHLKIFQAAAKTERYDDLKKAFLENYLQQKKCIKDPVEIQNIKQRNRESMEEFVRRYKLEYRDHSLEDRWRPLIGNKRSRFHPGNKKPDRSKTSKGETFGMNKVEKRNASKFCEFHGEVGHTTDECMHLKRQIEEMLEAGKLSHLIKELKQNNEKDQTKTTKKGETSRKDKALAILMVQPWQKITRQRITETFSSGSEISFPTLGEEDRTEGPMIIEVEMGGHYVHRIYVDGGSLRKSYIAASKDRRRGTLNIRSNEFHGDEITLSLQRDYRKAGEEGRNELCGLLRHHLNVFAWKPADMTGVPRHIVEHRLNVHEGCLPIRQKKRGQALERNKAISKEVKKLVEAGIMKEDLNKACPKDGYPLPEIDWKVESLCGYPYKCFLDAYKGYHQIKMAEKDEEKITFSIRHGILCYSKMPFGLKNAGATYQCLVDKAFQKQIGRNLEINMKLNPKKCAFGMREGTFLGYKVDADGLRVSPDKLKAVIELSSPKCLKDVQKLKGKLASLNKFLSKSAEKSLPFFKTLKKCTKKSDFQWTPEAEEAFKEMKQSIAKLPMLTAPKEKEELIIYLAAAKEAISTVLMTERDGKQVPIYFVSRALKGPEVNYTPIEKLILALDDTPDTPMEDREELLDPWILFTDGSSCVDGSGACLIIINPEGMEFTYALRFRFNATNNEVEYEALMAGLRKASQMGIQNLQENVDSKLVANQRGKQESRCISKIASTSFAHLSKQVLVEELREKAIDKKEILAVVEEEGHTWMTLVYEYLTEGVLHEEKKKARTVRRKAGRYAMISEVLYQKSFLGPWLQYVGPLQANYVLREIHKGSCSMHAGSRFVVAKALRLGYFWPTMHTDARNLIRELIPAEIGMPTLRTAEVDVAKNNEALGISLDLLEEKREQTAIQEARSKAKMEGYYNARVRSASFRQGDFVYRNNKASHAEDGGKLEPKWEGPYEVTEALGKGAYKLKDCNGHTLPRTWNVCNLKKCYIHEM